MLCVAKSSSRLTKFLVNIIHICGSNYENIFHK